MFYDEYEVNFYEEQNKQILEFIGDKTKEEIKERNLQIGDKIVVYFYPASQKYIYTLYPKYGTIIENTNQDNDDFSLMNIMLKNNNTEYEAFHGGVGLYSRAFDYKVFKLV
jgi:hypothetical protein